MALHLLPGVLTKGGLNAITVSLASEYAKNNIRSPHLRSDTGEAAWERDSDRGWGGCGVGHFVLAPLNWFWRKDPASLKPFGQKGNSEGFRDTFPVIVFGQKLSPAGFVLLGGSTGGFLAMVRLL